MIRRDLAFTYGLGRIGPQPTVSANYLLWRLVTMDDTSRLPTVSPRIVYTGLCLMILSLMSSGFGLFTALVLPEPEPSLDELTWDRAARKQCVMQPDVPDFIRLLESGDLSDPNATLAGLGLKIRDGSPEKLVSCRWPRAISGSQCGLSPEWADWVSEPITGYAGQMSLVVDRSAIAGKPFQVTAYFRSTGPEQTATIRLPAQLAAAGANGRAAGATTEPTRHRARALADSGEHQRHVHGRGPVRQASAGSASEC